MARFRFGTDPWQDLLNLQQEMNTVFESVFGRREAGTPPCNIWEGDDDVLVTAQLPGVTLDNLDISVMGDTLTIRSEAPARDEASVGDYHRRERATGPFARSVRLPSRIDAEKVQADYNDGILKIQMPKAADDKPRKIAIKPS